MPAIIARTVEKNDLTLARPLARGASGRQVRTVQEWLSLNGFSAGVDGVFGPGTDKTLRDFQAAKNLQVNGTVDDATFSELTAPIRRASAIPVAGNASINSLIISIAKQHLAENPREVGGQNLGPWVRLYMDGNEGKDWPWCAGFTTFVIRQAAIALAGAAPIERNFSCDVLATNAKHNNKLVSDRQLLQAGPTKFLAAGCVFLVRRTPTDWEHTGIVTAFNEETFDTVEGNTNDSGDREGYEVCKRTRSYANKDFIRIG